MLQDSVAVLQVGRVNHVTVNFQAVDCRSGDYTRHKTGNIHVRINVTLKSVLVTIAAVDKQYQKY